MLSGTLAENKFYTDYPAYSASSFQLVQKISIPMNNSNWTAYGTDNGNFTCNGTECLLTVFDGQSGYFEPIHIAANNMPNVGPGWMIETYAEFCAGQANETLSDSGVGIGMDLRNQSGPPWDIIGTLNGLASRSECPNWIAANQTFIIPPADYNSGTGYLGRVEFPQLKNTTNGTMWYIANGTLTLSTTSGNGGNFGGRNGGKYMSILRPAIWFHIWFHTQNTGRLRNYTVTFYQNISFTPPPVYNVTFASPTTQSPMVTANATKVTINFTLQQDGAVRTNQISVTNVTFDDANSSIVYYTTFLNYTELRYSTVYNLNYYDANTRLYANLTPYQDCGNWNNGTENFAPKYLSNQQGILQDRLSVDTNGDLVLCTVANGATQAANVNDSALMISRMRNLANSTKGTGVFWNVTGNSSILSLNFTTKFVAGKLRNSTQFCALTFINGSNTVTLVNITTANTSSQGNLSGQPWNNQYLTVNYDYKCPDSGCTNDMAIRAHMLGDGTISTFCMIDQTVLRVGINTTVIENTTTQELSYTGSYFSINVTTPNMTYGYKNISIGIHDIITGSDLIITNKTAALYLNSNPEPPTFSQACPVVSSGPYNDTNANWTLNCNGIISDPNGDNIYNTTWWNSSSGVSIGTFPFNINTNDFSGFNNSFSTGNASIVPSIGYDGSSALNFIGKKEYLQNPTFNISNGTDLSICFRISTNFSQISPSTFQPIVRIISVKAGDGNRTQIGTDGSNPARFVSRTDTNSTANQNSISWGNNTDLTSHSICVVWDYPTVIHYFDGINVANKTVTGYAYYSNPRLEIGSSGSQMNFTLDDLQIFNYSITSGYALSYNNTRSIMLPSDSTVNEVWTANIISDDLVDYSKIQNSLTVLNLSCNAGEVESYEDLLVSSNTRLCARTYLQNDSDGNGSIAIRASNVILDCNGAAIIGNLTPGSRGISLSNMNNVTIKNCNIGYFNTNLYNFNGNNLTLTNNTVSYSIGLGIRISGLGEVKIIGNTINNSGSYGIWLTDATNATLIVNNTLFNNTRGIVLEANASYNNISGNRITYSSSRGIHLLGNNDFNHIFENNVSFSSTSAIALEGGADFNYVYNNWLYNSTSPNQIFQINANDTFVFNNSINFSGRNGIDVGGLRNNISYNVITNANHHCIDLYTATEYSDGSFNRIYNNYANGCDLISIYVGSQDHAEIYNNTVFNRIGVEGNKSVTFDTKVYNNTISSDNISLYSDALNTSFMNNYILLPSSRDIFVGGYNGIANQYDNSRFVNNFYSIGTANYSVASWGIANFSVTENSSGHIIKFLNNSAIVNFSFKGIKNFTVTNNSIQIYSLSSPFDDVRNVSNGVLLCSNALACNVTLLPNQAVEVGDFEGVPSDYEQAGGYCSDGVGLAPLLQLVGLLAIIVTVVFLAIVLGILSGFLDVNGIPAIENLLVAKEFVIAMPLVGMLIGIGIMVIGNLC